MNPRQALALLGLCLVLLTPLVARKGDLLGQVFDREAFLQAKSFCVDTSYLGSRDLAAVKSFLKNESRPAKLLDKFPWTLDSKCEKAEVTARIYFKQVTRTKPGGVSAGAIGEMSGGISPGAQSVNTTDVVFQPVLLIYGPTSVQLIYRTEGRKKGKDLEGLLASPFLNLWEDLKSLGD